MTACVSTEQLGGGGGPLGACPPRKIRCSEIAFEAIAQLRQATNAAARAELCYISLASLALSLQTTSMYVSACMTMWSLKKSWKVSKIGPAMA